MDLQIKTTSRFNIKNTFILEPYNHDLNTGILNMNNKNNITY